MAIEFHEIEREDMQSKGGFQEGSWQHGKIRETLEKAYESKVKANEGKEEGDDITIEFLESEAYNEFVDNDLNYKDWINTTNHPHATFTSQIAKNMEKVGFSTESKLEKRKSAVGYGKNEDGEYMIKVELNPIQED